MIIHGKFLFFLSSGDENDSYSGESDTNRGF